MTSSSQSALRLHGQGQEGRQAVLRLAQPDAHARLYVPLAEVQGADEQRNQLRPRRGRDDPARRHRRQHHEEAGRHRRGRQHHPRVHHRQRHRDVHLARRRQHAVQGTKGHGLRGRLPRPVHRPLAGQDQAGHGRERHLLRPRLVPHLRRRRRRSRHHRQAPEGREDRRPDLQEPPRRLQPDGPAAGQGAVRSVTRSSTSAGPSSGPFASTT